MSVVTVEAVSNRLSDLGEGPHWDKATHSLLYVDAFVGDVCRLNPYTKESQTMHFQGVVTFVIPYRSNPEYTLVTNKRCIRKLHWPTKTSTLLTEVEKDMPMNNFNDGKCDVMGRLWAGTRGGSNPDGSLELGKGSLYSFDKEFKTTRHINGTDISNGMTWIGNKLYFNDSETRKTYVFDYDVNAGSTSNAQVWLDWNQHPLYVNEGYPDGMTNDAEGKLWIACYNGGQVLRIDPDSKEILFRVTIPAKKTTSCCWGGDNLNDLFVTTGFGGLNEHERMEQPLSGAVFRVSGLGVKGVDLHTYAD